MSLRRIVLWSAAATLALVLAGVWACSSSNNSNPTAPSGGGPELNSGDFGQNAQYQHRFMTAGAYPYHCIHHPPMTGSVTVSDGAADTLVNVSITSSTSPFPAATVKTGGRVVWTNNTAMVHTVTSN